VIFGLAGLVGALVGAFASNLVSSSLLQKLFGVYAIVLTVPMALTSRRRFNDPGQGQARSQPLTVSRILWSSLFGLISGVMAGLFGTSGTATIVAGLYILGMPVTMVVGTSVLVVLFNALSGLVGHMIVGQFNLTLLILLGSGSIVGAFLGPRVLAKIKVRTLERLYGILFTLLVISFGIIMIAK
jgi:hypothetical protein